MKYISHRGNIDGPNPEYENSPEYILNAIEQGYHVEIDVWYKDFSFWLGHDDPQYKIPWDFFYMPNDMTIDFVDRINEGVPKYNEGVPKYWCHAKNFEAIVELDQLSQEYNFIHYFWHEDDLMTLTSRNYIWTANFNLIDSIVVHMDSHGVYGSPDCVRDYKRHTKTPPPAIYGVCSDWIGEIRPQKGT